MKLRGAGVMNGGWAWCGVVSAKNDEDELRSYEVTLFTRSLGKRIVAVMSKILHPWKTVSEYSAFTFTATKRNS